MNSSRPPQNRKEVLTHQSCHSTYTAVVLTGVSNSGNGLASVCKRFAGMQQLRLQAPPQPQLREQLQAILLLRALVELQPAYSKSERRTDTPMITKYLHSSCADRDFKFRKWFGIGLQMDCRMLNASLDDETNGLQAGL